MAVGVELASVLAVKVAVDRHWPGGLDAFCQSQPNYIEDAFLARVGFMSDREADALVEQLLAAGLGGGEVVALGRARPLTPWLREASFDGARGVWLAGTERGRLVPPVHAVTRRGPERILDLFSEPGADLEVTGVLGSGEGNSQLVVRGCGGLVDVTAVRTNNGQGAVLATRRPARRTTCVEDIELLKWLGAELDARGARAN